LISRISTHIFSLSTKLLLSCPVVQGTVVAGGGNGNGNGYGGGGGGGISCGHATEIHTLPAVSGTGKCSTHTVTAIAARHTCTRMPGKTGIWGFEGGKKGRIADENCLQVVSVSVSLALTLPALLPCNGLSFCL